ncbi:hypothetical protein MtrunA17_Chr2g0320531 [Medicago truncatula]|uniref:Transmembrane protein n=1 Tax=Medicago truncatula TaxID=3880 RepID=A0A396JGA4_MEDTR|nr:hypothetical protein MtrunA17_Chr2g0320531 [Medicago truncatula]
MADSLVVVLSPSLLLWVALSKLLLSSEVFQLCLVLGPVGFVAVSSLGLGGYRRDLLRWFGFVNPKGYGSINPKGSVVTYALIHPLIWVNALKLV